MTLKYSMHIYIFTHTYIHTLIAIHPIQSNMYYKYIHTSIHASIHTYTYITYLYTYPKSTYILTYIHTYIQYMCIDHSHTNSTNENSSIQTRQFKLKTRNDSIK